MLDFYVAASKEDIQRLLLRSRVSLGGPIYWFLQRYFVQASLNPGDLSFLNPNEDTELSGYQLHRLTSELSEALIDLSARPHQFAVLLGWKSILRGAETEDRQNVERAAVERAVHELLMMLREAESSGQCVFAIGD